jgi:hypothetical protein
MKMKPRKKSLLFKRRQGQQLLPQKSLQCLRILLCLRAKSKSLRRKKKKKSQQEKEGQK